MRFSDPPSAALTFMEGRFSFRIRIKWWVGLLLTDIGKALATRQELFPTTPFRDNDPPSGPLKAYFPSGRLHTGNRFDHPSPLARQTQFHQTELQKSLNAERITPSLYANL